VRLSPRLPDQLVSLNVRLRLAVFGVVSEVFWQSDNVGEVVECRDSRKMVSQSAKRLQSLICVAQRFCGREQPRQWRHDEREPSIGQFRRAQ
jgi:hypothetical protein